MLLVNPGFPECHIREKPLPCCQDFLLQWCLLPDSSSSILLREIIKGSFDECHPVLLPVDFFRPVAVVKHLEDDDGCVVPRPEALRQHGVLKHCVSALLHLRYLEKKNIIISKPVLQLLRLRSSLLSCIDKTHLFK
jgi:hypothetical protein